MYVSVGDADVVELVVVSCTEREEPDDAGAAVLTVGL